MMMAVLAAMADGMTKAEQMMADFSVGVIMAVAFAMVMVIVMAMYDPEPLEYL
jgi:phenylacetate-coenzyme A ligase PaaK-like adenylate-forming protein